MINFFFFSQAMEAYKKVIVEEKKRVNKEGCVQLRFDLRFLVSILHGRRGFISFILK